MSLTDKKAWQALREHAQKNADLHLNQILTDKTNRFDTFSRRSGTLLIDFSKQRIKPRTMQLLCDLARECDLETWIEKLFSGEAINASENRSALHTALRMPADREHYLGSTNIVQGIQDTLQSME